MKFKDCITPVIDRDYDTLEDALDAVNKLAQKKESEEWGVVKFFVTNWGNLERLPYVVNTQYCNSGDECVYRKVKVTYPDESLYDKLYPIYEGSLIYRYSLQYTDSSNTNSQIIDTVEDMNQYLENSRFDPIWKTVDL